MILEMFSLPFMQRAFLAGTFVSILLGWIGVYTVTRKMSFVGDGVAHASLASVAIAILLGLAPMPVAVFFSVVLGSILFVLHKYTNLSTDAGIGIIFTTSMALGLLILQYHDGYVPELVSFLFGNILSITNMDLWLLVVIGSIVMFSLAYFHKQLSFITIDTNGAQISGIRTTVLEWMFFCLTSVSVVLSMKLLGIILVSGLLIIPSAIGKQLARSWKQFFIYSIVASLLTMWLGLTASYIFDWPSGASIIVVGALGLLIVSLGSKNS